MERIAIEVDTTTAKAYEAASEEDIEKLKLLLNLWSKGVLNQPRRSIEEIMQDIAAQAAANGLTPEILQSILDDDTDDDE